MEISEVVTQALSGIPEAILEKSRFGRSEQVLFWLSAPKLLEAAAALKNEAGFDWLENISAMQVDAALVFTYFIRRFETGESLIIRVSADLGPGVALSGKMSEWVSLTSVASVWPMAVPFESEIARLFGVKIPGQSTTRLWDGFPLRKSFVIGGGIPR